ncbi:MAG TPA: dTMP kinase [Methylococcaceae bacterium]|nr:dTMP kinase [Methylococcaceae bacterium]
MPGKFITLEGGEGAGKSLNLGFVRDFLLARDVRVVTTREPGGTELGEKLRSVLLGDGKIQPEAELLLVYAARAQHLAEIIRPALQRGDWVLCDRFSDATFAYQGGGRRLAVSAIQLLENWVVGDSRPDLTLLLDTPVAVGQARIQRRGAPDRFEAEETAFFERVRAVYRQRAAAEPARIKVVDASAELVAVQRQIAACLQPLFGVV